MNPEFETLINADELSASIHSPNNRKMVLVDCRFNLMQPDAGRADYNDGHLPGAHYAHLDDDLAAPVTQDSGRHPLPDQETFRRLAGHWGVMPESQVVVYDQDNGAVAARLWWMMRWIGHKRVALLDGGYRVWLDSGFPVTTEIPRLLADPKPSGLPGEHARWRSTSELVRDMDRLCLLDARSRERFNGHSEPIDTLAGHVPGAINRPFSENLDNSGRFLDASALRDQFLQLLDGCDGAGEDQRIVHMCGSGVTACHNILAMEIAGLDPSDLYVGSWSEWIRDPARPVITREE